MLDPLWRRRALAGLAAPFDLIVLGGGITGCGIFLDAAQRGLRVLLLERGDIASGTSSRSSKLIHGGLRYLKRLQFQVTRLAVRERDRMLAVDPHLVWPIRFLFPVYQGGRPPGWQVEMGLRLYSRMTGGRQRHRRLSPEELEQSAPGVATEGLAVTFSYGDAVTDDARLTLAVAATGAAYGGLLLTRIELEDGVRDASGRLRGLRFRDLETGEVHAADASLTVNAAGAWVDAVRHRLGVAGARVRPSRGSHLIFARERLPITEAVTIPSPDDRRPVFFIPHPEGVLAGTTDLFHDGDLDDPRPAPEEIGYLLRSVQAAFPGRAIGPGDIRGAFAGLRPIVDSGAADPSAASREEAVWEEEGLLSVAGGKLTTWRAMAEEVVDRALRLLPPERARHASPCATAGTPVGALAPRDLAERLRAVHDAGPEVAAGLARRLGGLAWTACALARGAEELRPLLDGTDLCAAEVRAHLRHGAVARLEDLLLRRARFGLWDPPAARALVPRLAPLFRDELGWSAGRWERETAAADQALAAWTPEGAQQSKIRV
ncbi:MAG TPA: glycerol-3-phosphate dehydrogenase/oxidase [Thermoanaerobaculia bacterium]|nr:glycerol-3-phosphate dehydrogenase/oxidase [Thermoanaerobaculia bacterium]